MELTTTSRKRAAELDEALAGGVVPAQANGVAREVAVVTMLRELGTATAPAPTDEFRAALRTRLMAVAAVQGVGQTAPAPVPAAVSWRQRVATVAAGLTAGAVAVGGVSAAASMSVPGDPFYDVKRAAEGVQLWLADGAAEEGARHAQFAAERLSELEEMAADGSLSERELADARELLDEMDAATRDAYRLLSAAFRDTQDAAPLEQLARFADQQRDGLTQLVPALPDDLQPRARTSIVLLGEVRTAADELLLLRDCTAVCDPEAGAPVLELPAGPAGSPCECPTPAPAPSVAPPPAPSPSATPAPAPAPSGSAPAPSPAPTGPAPTSSPAPTRTPVVPLPLPSNPLPPLPTLPGLDPDDPVDLPSVPLVDDLLGLSRDVTSPALGPVALGALLGWW